MKAFFEKHGYDTLLAVFGILFGGSVVGLSRDVVAAFREYPWAMAACCGLSLVVGLAVSAIADRRAVKVAEAHEAGETERARLAYEEREAERKRVEAAEAESRRKEEEEEDAENASSFKRLDVKDKEFLRAIYVRGHADIPSCRRLSIEMSDYCDMIDYETVGDDDRWRLEPWAKSLFDRNPGLFDVLDEWFDA